MPPEYKSPPATNQLIPPIPRPRVRAGRDAAASHPITTYKVTRIQWGCDFQKRMISIPAMAMVHTVTKRVKPWSLRNVIRQIGVYVPAIRRKIAMWSKL